MQPEPQPPSAFVIELLIASGAALAAGYVRARTDAPPLSLGCMAARLAEAVVCGFLAVALIAVLEQAAWIPLDDQRVLVGLSAGLGLMGTSVVSDLLTAWIKRRAER